MTGSIIRAEVESGATYDDPTEELLLDLAERVHSMGEEFLVVNRTGAPDGQTFIQCAETRDDDGMWRLVVEYREGGPDRHFRAYVDELDVLQSVITGWAAGRLDWRGGLEWERHTFDQ
ncbi:hypothetical protein [Micromonospora sp. NPDC023633]|uniref:hypothetical protein n=1 Tax=Micromonospora sp. NPDC023633 TaxID=3154320 RepID=UPI0033E40D4F